MRIGRRFNIVADEIHLNDKPIAWVKEIRYLGLYIVAASSFKCNLHYAKIKKF